MLRLDLPFLLTKTISEEHECLFLHQLLAY